MGGVPGKNAARVSLAEDQHPVGDLGSNGQHEPFGEAVRPRTPRREFQRVHHDPRGTTGSVLWLLQIAGHQRAKKRAMSHARSLQPWVSPKINDRRY